MVSPIRFKKL